MALELETVLDGRGAAVGLDGVATDPLAARFEESEVVSPAGAVAVGAMSCPNDAASSGSESDELEASSAVVFLVGSSSGSSSILGLDILEVQDVTETVWASSQQCMLEGTSLWTQAHARV